MKYTDDKSPYCLSRYLKRNERQNKMPEIPQQGTWEGKRTETRTDDGDSDDDQRGSWKKSKNTDQLIAALPMPNDPGRVSALLTHLRNEEGPSKL